MKLIKQLAIILLMTFLGEFFNYIIPLPVPAAIWGMLLLFISLVTGIVKLDMVETVADYFNSIMVLIFVPFGVSIMTSYSQLKDYLLQILIIIAVSFFVVFFVSGKSTDLVITLMKKKNMPVSGGKEEAAHE